MSWGQIKIKKAKGDVPLSDTKGTYTLFKKQDTLNLLIKKRYLQIIT